MEISKIDCCRLCESTSLDVVFDFGVQALSTRFPGPDDPDAEQVPLTLVRCEDCGLVQLTHNYDLDDLYRRGYGYRSGVNQTMRDHLGGIVAQIENFVDLQPGDTVLDIASNDGTLLDAYAGESLNLVGIDPTVAQYAEYYPEKAFVSAEFFTRQTYLDVSPTPTARAISSIAVFYDVPDPVRFVKEIASILSPDGVWVMEQSYLPTLVSTLSFDSICHEHLGYYCLKQIEYVAERAGLRVFDVETNDMNGGSIRAFLCHRDGPFATVTASLERLRKQEIAAKLDELQTFRAFYEKIMGLGKELVNVLSETKAAGKLIHIYGASTKGNVLLQLFGIGRSLIDAAAERNDWKFGHRTPGTNIPIISEAESRTQNPDYYLVLPWHFRDEFVKREKAFIDNGGKLIFPLPRVEIFPDG